MYCCAPAQVQDLAVKGPAGLVSPRLFATRPRLMPTHPDTARLLTISGRAFGLLAIEMVCLLSVLPGCGSADGLNRQAVSGSVLLDGRPLESGAILFEPGNSQLATAVGSLIRRGRFAISRDQGAVPDEYLVRIYASSNEQSPPAKGHSNNQRRPMLERIPARYNVHSELRATVAAHKANDFQFQLRSDSSGEK